MLKDVLIELERAAKAFNLGDVDTAALCCRKAVEGHTKMAPPEPTPDPFATDTHSELMKSVTALESKDYSVAALCLEKASERISGRINGVLVEHLHRAAQGIREENFTTVAEAFRDGIAVVVGERPLEPVELK